MRPNKLLQRAVRRLGIGLAIGKRLHVVDVEVFVPTVECV